MENLKFIEEVFRLIGIHDNMILHDTINISGKFIVDTDSPRIKEKMKITVDFEVQLPSTQGELTKNQK